jgi:hypothetical protein
MPTITEATDWRELARRSGNGIDVALLWSKSSNRLKLSVFDTRFEEHLDLEVLAADALSAFKHPFAYAAWRGLDSSAAKRDGAALQLQD